jgi:hypothetical protein
MHQTRALHHPRQLDNIVRADDVRPQRGFERRVERDVARAVDNHVAVRHDRARFLFRHPEKFVPDIAVHGHDFFADKFLEIVAVFFP